MVVRGREDAGLLGASRPSRRQAKSFAYACGEMEAALLLSVFRLLLPRLQLQLRSALTVVQVLDFLAAANLP